ncbi:MAG: hypothetical protein KDK23_10885 [Leptospiraceae bacterium]|nr:hypothetical protein [Leptospiraceae bacterium]
MIFHRKPLVIVTTIIALLFSSTLLADTILLRNGTQINGRIIQQNQANVVIVRDNRRQVIPKTQIARILYNNKYTDDDADKKEEERKAAEEKRKREEERRKQIEEQRRKAEEEKRRQQEQEQKKQQEILEQIEEEKREEQKRLEEEKRREEERRKAEEEQSREQTNVNQTDTGDSWDFFDALMGKDLNQHQIRFRLEGGGGRVRPLFVPALGRINTFRGLVDNKAVTSSPAAYLDGLSYGGEIEYVYDRFLVRLASRRLSSSYSLASYELGTTTDALTGLPTDSFNLSVDYARDLSLVEHSLGVGYSVYYSDVLEVRPVVEYMGQFTRLNQDGSSFAFETSSLATFAVSDAKNRMWVRGVRGGLEVLYRFDAFGQNFEWKIYGAAVQTRGSVISDSRMHPFSTAGQYQGLRTFRVNPQVFYEATHLESVLYYRMMPELRLYIGLAGQTGTANASDLDIAQNFGGLSPEEMLASLYNFNQNYALGGLRSHHSRISFGAEYSLDL